MTDNSKQGYIVEYLESAIEHIRGRIETMEKSPDVFEYATQIEEDCSILAWLEDQLCEQRGGEV